MIGWKAKALIVAAAIAAAPAQAQECSGSVSKAIDSYRRTYVDGMAGVAGNNFSSRPGSFSSMACLDKFMQGNMDIFFKPISLDSLLEQAMSFACDKLESAIGGSGGGGLDAIGMFSDMSGGNSFAMSGSGSSISVPSVGELFSR